MSERVLSVSTALLAVLSCVIAVLALAAWLRWGMRCDEGCYQRATEPGESWTRYRDSWQWHAQFALALLAVIAAATAIMTLRVRPLAGVPAAMIAVTCAGGWIAWYLATPLHA
jgi:hypothetical protein